MTTQGLFALQLLILKAQDETGQPLFQLGEIANADQREVQGL